MDKCAVANVALRGVKVDMFLVSPLDDLLPRQFSNSWTRNGIMIVVDPELNDKVIAFR
jgi:hypothetical protein